MAKFPSPYSVQGPGSLRSSGPIAQIDTSGLARGQEDLARGFQQAGSGFMSASGDLAGIAQRERQKIVASQYAQAEAQWTRGALDLGNKFATRSDYENFASSGEEESHRIMQEAAAVIEDDAERERWLQATELKRLAVADSFTDLGRVRTQQREMVRFGDALTTNAKLISDPTIAPVLREKAREDTKGALAMGEQTGLLTPDVAYEYRVKFLDQADENLAINIANYEIEAGDPLKVLTGMGVSSTLAGRDVAQAAMLSGAVDLPPTVAQQAAITLGDRAFPDDPALAKAYLKDPEMRARYVGAAVDTLTDQFKGDVSAAVIALAPGGGVDVAERWVKSKHDEATLPPGVRDFYRKTMRGVTPQADLIPMPIVAASDVNLEQVDIGVLDRYEQVQSAFGKQLPVISGHRDAERNAEVGGAKSSQHIVGKAIDVDVSGLSEEERVRFIETASAMGFTGIGVYKSTIHLDAGGRRAWGGDYHRESVPGWAEEAITRHLAGAITDAAPAQGGVAPEFAALSYDQRLKLYAAAKQQVDNQAVDLRAGLSIAVDNAPSAIMSTGNYDGTMPNADDFVAAWGAADGIERFKAFDAAVDVAETAYGMRTMTAEQIADAVEGAVPVSSGDSAAIEAKAFDALSQAAETTLKARKDDPAGYVMQTFPNVEAAWTDVQDSPDGYVRAVTATVEAQAKLGMEEMQPLPKAMAAQAAAAFNSTDAPQDQRIGAVTGLILPLGDETQRAAVFDQLVEAGVPPHVRGAFAALERGDAAASSYLFRAAMTDPSKLPGQLPNNIKSTEVTTQIQDLLLDPDQIGDVIYGISDGTAENFDRLQADGVLMERAVKLRLIDGSATSVDQAVKMTAKDMWGDLQVVTGKGWGDQANVKLALPADEDPKPLRRGFDALLDAVGEALKAEASPFIAGAATNDGEAAVMAAVRDNGIAATLEEGYFVERNGGYVFVEPWTNSAVSAADGSPLIFSRAEVLEAGAAAGAEAVPPPLGQGGAMFDPFGVLP